MVDAARQMLDELMGRNRNLHPSEAPRPINWDDPEFCQYYIVKFCPHDLFVNTRADLGVCYRIHDDEAKKKYEEAKPSHRKKQFEDEFLHFCNSMLNDVDRKIQKGKQRLKLMQKDQPVGQSHMSKYQEQLNNLNARIKKLLAEAEEAGIRGDVDQAQDLMNLCEQLKEEKDALVAQHENMAMQAEKIAKITTPNATTSNCKSYDDKSPVPGSDGGEDGEDNISSVTDKKMNAWMQDMGHIPEKQMEVCEVCGAFLIVGDAQQRIEDHLTGKQHLGFLKLRKAVEEIHARRKKEREEEQRRKRDDYYSRNRNSYSHDMDRKGEHNDRGRSRDHGSNHQQSDRHRRHHKSHHRRRSHSRGRSHRNSRDRRDSHSRSRSRSRY